MQDLVDKVPDMEMSKKLVMGAKNRNLKSAAASGSVDPPTKLTCS